MRDFVDVNKCFPAHQEQLKSSLSEAPIRSRANRNRRKIAGRALARSLGRFAVDFSWLV